MHVVKKGAEPFLLSTPCFVTPRFYRGAIARGRGVATFDYSAVDASAPDVSPQKRASQEALFRRGTDFEASRVQRAREKPLKAAAWQWQ